MIANAWVPDPFGPAPAGVRLRAAVVRHGEAHRSVRGRCCGSLDPPLSDEGRRQLEETSGLLERLAPVAIYTSPRLRALDSARALAMTMPLTIDDRLAEIDFGVLEGLTYQEVADRYPIVWRTWMHRPADVVFPGGERFDAFTARIDNLLADLKDRHPGQAIVIVAHGGVNRVILARALDLELRRMFRLQQSPGAVSLIDFYDDQAVVQAMNATMRRGTPC